MISDDSTRIFKSTGLEQFFILGLFDVDRVPFTEDGNQMTVQAKLRGNILDHYTWDVRELSKSYSKGDTRDNYEYLSKDLENWRPMFINSFDHDQGSKIVKPISTFNPVNTFASFTSSNFQTKNRINLNPITKEYLLPEDYADRFLDFHSTLYKAFIIPGYPLLFTSTLENAYLYGPQFIDKISIQVSANSPVSIDLETSGGRILFSDSKTAEELPSQNKYRTFKNFDCAFDFKAHKTSKDFFEVVNNRTEETLLKIVSMSLSVDNAYDIKATAVHSTENVLQGPRFFTITERNVTGTLTFIASSSEFLDKTKAENKGLTLYFGGQFLFILPNIVWQKPRIKLASVSDLYIHEYDFIAFAADGTLANAYKAYANEEKFDISEFKLPNDNRDLEKEAIKKESSKTNGT